VRGGGFERGRRFAVDAPIAVTARHVRQYPTEVDEWHFSIRDAADGEWLRWDSATASERPDLVEAVADFEAFAGKNDRAAREATAWLRQDSQREEACVTRILVVESHVAMFYAMASGETSITSSKRLERMGIHGGSRVGSSHIEWIGRDRRAPSGIGWLAIQHAITVALRISRLQGNRAMTLDPYDADTQAMWEAMGFHKSQTELDDGLRRLYIPLFGQDYGSLKRASGSPG
jgi:hypothetical protein